MRWLRRRRGAPGPPTTPAPAAPSGSDTEVAPPAPTRGLRPPPSIVGVRDPDVAATLARDGYVRLGRVLDDDACARLRSAFDHVEANLGRPLGDQWFPTILLPDAALRAYIDDQLRPVVMPALAPHLDLDVLETVRVDYSVKPDGPESLLGPHQDFSIVDERRWTSLYVWIPLIATDAVNGTLHVLPGSHRYSNTVRSRHVPAMFDPVLDEVEASSIVLECEPGELIVMVSGVVHFSPPNRSGALRLAAHGIFKPAEAPLVFYFADDETPADQVELYEVGIDDYIELALGERPGERFARSATCPREPVEMEPERFAAGRAAYDAERA